MSIGHALGRQLRHPAGAGGWLVGHLMRLANARPNVLAVASLGLLATDSVLDLGCGPGHAVGLMAERTQLGVVHGVDQSLTMLAQARARNRDAILSGRVRLHWSRFEALPFASRSMDKVLAVNVAYFWRDAGRVLGEVRRVLRPGGLLSVYVTDASTMRRWKFVDAETHRLFSRGELVAILRWSGFPEDRIAVTDIRLPGRITGLIATAGTPRER